jgi:hypothetical protein
LLRRANGDDSRRIGELVTAEEIAPLNELYVLRLQFICTTDEVGPLTDMAIEVVAAHGGKLSDSRHFFAASMLDLGFTFAAIGGSWETLLADLKAALPTVDRVWLEEVLHPNKPKTLLSYKRRPRRSPSRVARGGWFPT